MIEDKIQKRTLSIRVSTNGFCFCSYIPSQENSLQYHFFTPSPENSLTVNLKRAVEECPFDVTDCDIKAIIETDEYTALPAEYDNRQDYKSYYRYCFPKSNSNVEIVSNRLNAHNITILFPVEKAVYEFLQKLGEITFYTPISILAGYLTHTPLPEERYMLAYMNNSHMLLLSINNGNIATSNIFKSENKENSLFYLLSIWKEQGLSQTEDTLYICGDSDIEEFGPECSRFIKEIKRLNPTSLFSPNLLTKLKEIPFDLQALLLCE